jgi:hypothetical protein
MNLLGLVIALLLVLSYGASCLFHKHVISNKLQSSYVGLRKAERSLLRQSERLIYQDLNGVPKKMQPKEKKTYSLPSSPPVPPLNPPCCRLNLFPLLFAEPAAEPVLYDLALQLFEQFYAPLLAPGSERLLLDAILAAARKKIGEQQSVCLETLQLSPESLQEIYYRLLKGAGPALPSLLDYLKIDRDLTPICLFHAHPNMLALFFGFDCASRLFGLLHQESCAGFANIESLLDVLREPQLRSVDPAVWELLDLKKPHHKGKVADTLIASDPVTGISIRRKIPS